MATAATVLLILALCASLTDCADEQIHGSKDSDNGAAARKHGPNLLESPQAALKTGSNGKKEGRKRGGGNDATDDTWFLHWRGAMTSDYRIEVEGADLEMECRAEGQPQPQVTWYKDGQRLMAKDAKVRLSRQNARLRLLGLALRDEGNYTCVVDNGGETQLTHSYSVYVKKPVAPIGLQIISEMQNLTAYAGDNVTLPCRVLTSGRTPYMQWLKHYTVRGEWVAPNKSSYVEVIASSGRFENAEMQNFELYNVSVNDSTRYSCVVYDQVDPVHREHIWHWLKVLNETRPTKEPIYRTEVVEKFAPKTVIMLSSLGACLFVLLCLLAGVCICLSRRRRRKAAALEEFAVHHLLLDNELYRPAPGGGFQILVDPYWEIDRNTIVLGEKIGEGAFGRVMKGLATSLKGAPSPRPTPVAVKMLKEDAGELELEDLIKEMNTMKSISLGSQAGAPPCKNIVHFVGCCTQGGPLWVVVEYAPHGNLRDFLKSHRIHKSSGRPVGGPAVSVTSDPAAGRLLTEKDLVSFSRQCAKGLEYLAAQKILHRDVAARNVLVAADYVLKIADYGLARHAAAGKDYYKKLTDGRLPVKWMAPEALFDRTSTVASDVWSFGILLWEIFSMGGTPYPTVPLEDLFQLLREGHRNERPAYASIEIYSLMLKCWKYQPTERPTFSDLVQKLDSILASATTSTYLSLEGNYSVPSDARDDADADDDVFGAMTLAPRCSLPRVPARNPAPPRRSDSQYNSMSDSGNSSPESTKRPPAHLPAHLPGHLPGSLRRDFGSLDSGCRSPTSPTALPPVDSQVTLTVDPIIMHQQPQTVATETCVFFPDHLVAAPPVNNPARFLTPPSFNDRHQHLHYAQIERSRDGQEGSDTDSEEEDSDEDDVASVVRVTPSPGRTVGVLDISDIARQADSQDGPDRDYLQAAVSPAAPVYLELSADGDFHNQSTDDGSSSTVVDCDRLCCVVEMPLLADESPVVTKDAATTRLSVSRRTDPEGAAMAHRKWSPKHSSGDHNNNQDYLLPVKRNNCGESSPPKEFETDEVFCVMYNVH